MDLASQEPRGPATVEMSVECDGRRGVTGAGWKWRLSKRFVADHVYHLPGFRTSKATMATSHESGIIKYGHNGPIRAVQSGTVRRAHRKYADRVASTDRSTRKRTQPEELLTNVRRAEGTIRDQPARRFVPSAPRRRTALTQREHVLERKELKEKI